MHAAMMATTSNESDLIKDQQYQERQGENETAIEVDDVTQRNDNEENKVDDKMDVNTTNNIEKDMDSITDTQVEDEKNKEGEDDNKIKYGGNKKNNGKSDDKDNNESSLNNNDNERTWDFTNRKVVVHNIMKFMNPKRLKDMTNSWLEGLKKEHPTIEFVKVKKPPKGNWVRITLDSEAMVEPFIDYINSNKFTNKKGGVIHATRATDGNNDNRNNNNNKRDADDVDRRNKRQKVDGRENNTKNDNNGRERKDCREAITPLYKMEYKDQLSMKQREIINKCAIKIVQEIKGRFRILDREAKRNKHRERVKEYSWLSLSRPINVEEILPAPTLLRNKAEFTFGYRYPETNGEFEVEANNDDKKVPALGFMASGWSGGVSRPHTCRNIPDEACAIVDIVDEFLLQSPMPPYDSKSHTGFWRYLTARSSRRTGECMIIVVHAPTTGGAGAKETNEMDYTPMFESEKQRLVKLLTENELKLADTNARDFSNEIEFIPTPSTEHKEDLPVHVTSIYFQEFDGLSNPKPEHPVQHVFGKTALREKLGKCTFEISPGAFFQVITPGAENLYKVAVDKVQESVSNPQDTLLFDVCCGTGTIGLTCLKEGVVGKVIGVDISIPAIDDAIRNAELNGFVANKKTDSNSNNSNDERPASSCHFVASRAEHVLAQELTKARKAYKKDDNSTVRNVIAVVDPAREGLHQDVIKTLRSNEQIERIVYVSCNPTGSLVKDAGLLCAPATKKYGGRPFRPTFAQPVDMFPLTSHVELVITFDRMTDDDEMINPNNSSAKKVKTEATSNNDGVNDSQNPTNLNKSTEDTNTLDTSKEVSNQLTIKSKDP